MSVRDMVEQVQLELRSKEISPERGAELDNRLSALLGNVLEEIREADAAYNLVYLRELQTHEKANRAKIFAEASTAYQRKRTARDTETVVLEMIRSLRHLGRVNADAMRLSR